MNNTRTALAFYVFLFGSILAALLFGVLVALVLVG